jgi:hypothetical protein
MKRLELPHKSNLHPMIHVFKNSSGVITKQVLCYNPQGKSSLGRADHKYSAETCGWQQPLAFMYIGPVLCCRKCHRHIWSEENFNRCPQCARPLMADAAKKGAAVHSPVSRGHMPLHGKLVSTYAEGRF